MVCEVSHTASAVLMMQRGSCSHQALLDIAFLQECHCMLFLTEDNDFRGDDQAITLDEVIESTKGMSGVQQT